jgi:Fe-S-cluster containining protein
MDANRPAPSLTDALCTKCGLCCDGSLFADVELGGRREVDRIELLGLEVEDGGAGREVLILPCAALRGTRCGVYALRPACCRSFECGLLQRARRGEIAVGRAMETIATTRAAVARVKGILARLGERDPRLPLAERCAEALSAPARGTAKSKRARAELRTAMSAVRRSIRAYFLRDAVTPRSQLRG